MAHPVTSTVAAQRVLAAGRAARRAVLVSPFPLLIIETTPGAGAGDLLREWAAEGDSPDMRVLIHADQVSATGEQLIAALGRAVLGRRGAGTVPDGPGALSALSHAVAAARRPLSIAITRGDFLPVETFRDLLPLLGLRESVQLIVAGFDGTEFADEARRLGIPFRRIADEDLALSGDEIAAMLALAGFDADPGSVARLSARTLGLAGAVSAAIDILRDRFDGTPEGETLVFSPGEIGSYLFTAGIGHWPSHLVHFITTMAHLPRFTVAEANAVAEVTSARTYIDRMRGMRLGRVTFDPMLRRQTFTWFERARATTIEYLRHDDSPRAATRRTRRMMTAAQDSFDLPLYVSSLVALERFADAESYLADWFWDVLPNGFQPVWAPLAAIEPRRLADYPLLTAVRARVEPRRDSVAVARSMERFAVPTGGESAWQRLEALALGVEFARAARTPAVIADLVVRARDVARGVMSGALFGAAPAGAVSSLLVIGETAIRLGDLGVAAEFGRYALEFLDAGTRRLDPWGDRRDFAASLVLASDRERGVIDTVNAETVLAAPQFRWRDPDFVAYTIATCWAAIDEGDLAAADARCAAALQRVSTPQEWPGLWYLQLWIAGLRHGESRLAMVRGNYVASLDAVGLAREPAVDRTPTVLQRLGHLIGGYLPAPDGVIPGDVDGDFPRWFFDALLLDALEALRSERRGEARALLTRAIAVAMPRPLSTAALAVASADEIRELGDLVAGDPAAESLQLGHALEVAGQVSGQVELSVRELEVLALLRRGMTNGQIAQELFVSVNTIKFHRGRLMRKLGASSRMELLEAATRLGL